MSSQITKVAMDAHKKDHKVAYWHPETQELMEFKINHTAKNVKKMVKKMQREVLGEVIFHYEAGCLGFDLQRQIEAAGAQCKVIAPTSILIERGKRIKTDRRDARNLLDHIHCKQDLAVVQSPSPEQEVVRDLVRLREAAQKDLMRIRHQISKFMLRYGFAYRDGKHWTQKHLNWLQSRKLSEPLGNEVLAQMLSELDHRMKRCLELTRRIEQIAQEKPYREPVGWLCCFRGIDTLTAMTIMTELYCFERFSGPKQLMAFLGLVPLEYSSGESRKMGGITKKGNGRVRRVLIQAGWNQRHKPYPTKTLKKRREGQEQWVIDIADKCMKRLYKRYWHLVQKGKSTHCAATAVARELVGFIWQVLYTWISIVPEEGNSYENKESLRECI